jgi:putative ABC transport system permease protein
MYRIALKMLIEDRAKYLGMVLSLSFSALIITQQSGIFLGLMRRTFGSITDTNQADIWVMDPNVRFVDDSNPMRKQELFRVRSVEGVKWAVPLYKGQIRARVGDGSIQICSLIGIDDATLIGAPPRIIEGRLEDLRRPDAIIVDRLGGAEDKLARRQGPGLSKTPLQVGDTLELNDKRAYVTGICESTRSFQSNPVIYTTFKRALSYAPYERKLLSFILVKAQQMVSPKALCEKITARTGLAAYTQDEFEWRTVNYYIANTGIPINFGLAVLLGLLVGAALAGQIFYNFTTDNLLYLGLFSLMGASKGLLARMILLQALWLGFLGWGIGTGLSSLVAFATAKTELAFHLPWQLLLLTGFLMASICSLSALVSIRRIYSLELARIFKR